MITRLTLLVIMFYLTGCEACKEQGSCAQDDHSQANTYEPEEETAEEEKPDVVVTSGEALPFCDETTKNLTAFRESKNKYFVCKDGAWEEFKFPNAKSDLMLVWEKAKETLPTDEYLNYTCGILLSIDPKHICNGELNETE